MQQARERAARRSGTAARNLKDAGLPKIIAGKLQRGRTGVGGAGRRGHAKRVDDARHASRRRRARVRDDDAIVLDLPATVVPAGRTVFCEGWRCGSVGGSCSLTTASTWISWARTHRLRSQRCGKVDAATDDRR